MLWCVYLRFLHRSSKVRMWVSQRTVRRSTVTVKLLKDHLDNTPSHLRPGCVCVCVCAYVRVRACVCVWMCFFASFFLLSYFHVHQPWQRSWRAFLLTYLRPLLLYLLDSAQNKGFAVFCFILEMEYYAKWRQNNNVQTNKKPTWQQVQTEDQHGNKCRQTEDQHGNKCR